MARLRKANTCRTPNGQAWSRFSRKNPKKSFVRALPHSSLLIFKMGKQSDAYDLKMEMAPMTEIQLRSNALESARQVANKYLERNLIDNYVFRVLVYPYIVIREHRMMAGAGADRLSKGMSQSFGKPVSIAARVKKGQSIFMVRSTLKNRPIVHEALRRASSKLSGAYKIKAV